MGVVLREAVATAAARDAKNGPEFVREAEAAWGAPVRILSGQEEARLAGAGVLAAIHDADGIAADLGGGSLDMTDLRNGKTGEGVTLPVGPLVYSIFPRATWTRRAPMSTANSPSCRSFARWKTARFYAVGGIWRTVARVDMLREQYKLHMLQHYAIPSDRANALCNVLSKQGRKSRLELMADVSKRRMELLPYGAVVLQRLLNAVKFKQIVISANGLREGLLYEKMSEEERAKDPLIDFASHENIRQSRSPAHAMEMFHWASPLFEGENAEMRRLRLAFCLFSDIGWRRHPDQRARGSYDDVLNFPFMGTDHRARAFIASAVYFRYSGETDLLQEIDIPGLLDKQDTRRAYRIGLSARLAFDLSASATGELGQYRLRVTPSKVLLEAPKRRGMVADETVSKRLFLLGEALRDKAEILLRLACIFGASGALTRPSAPDAAQKAVQRPKGDTSWARSDLCTGCS